MVKILQGCIFMPRYIREKQALIGPYREHFVLSGSKLLQVVKGDGWQWQGTSIIITTHSKHDMRDTNWMYSTNLPPPLPPTSTPLLPHLYDLYIPYNGCHPGPPVLKAVLYCSSTTDTALQATTREAFLRIYITIRLQWEKKLKNSG